MKIAITQLCVPGTLDEVLEKTSKWGYEALELGVSEEGGVLNLSTSASLRKDIIRRIADRGLTLTSLVALPVAQHSLFDRTAGERQKGQELCRRILDMAAEMGADTILLVPGRLISETCYDEAMTLCVESLRALAPHAEACRVNIGIENVWNKFLVSPLDMKFLIESVRSRHVGAFVDVGNIVFWGYPEHWIRILAPYLKKIHFKDLAIRGMNLAVVPLRQGSVNWDAVMREIRAARYDGAIIAEVEGGDDPAMADAAQVMKKLVAQAGCK